MKKFLSVGIFNRQDPVMSSPPQSLTCRFDWREEAVKHMACKKQDLAKRFFVSRFDNVINLRRRSNI